MLNDLDSSNILVESEFFFIFLWYNNLLSIFIDWNINFKLFVNYLLGEKCIIFKIKMKRHSSLRKFTNIVISI